MSDSPQEKALFEATEKLGKAIQGAPEKEREIIRKLYDDVKEFAAQKEAEGVPVDKGAFFAAGIIFHPEIESEEVINGAREYVDADYAFFRHKEEATQA